YICFFFQAEDGIRDDLVTGVQTCALPICEIASHRGGRHRESQGQVEILGGHRHPDRQVVAVDLSLTFHFLIERCAAHVDGARGKIGRASCRERVEVHVVDGTVEKRKYCTG